MEKWLSENLVCPRDHQPLTEGGERLECTIGHQYPVVDGIPVMLIREAEPTGISGLATLRQIDLDEGQKAVYPNDQLALGPGDIDPYVQEQVAATNGLLYVPLVGRLPRYPIPYLRLPDANGKTFLDVGCNWGRWSIAAAKKGYMVVGFDPSLDAIRAARRVAQQIGVDVQYLVGDARYLPFRNDVFDVVFSYSVLQHLDKTKVRESLASIHGVLTSSGRCLIQMPNQYGLRSLYKQLRRGFQAPKEFDVRYWTPREMVRDFSRLIGPCRLSVDGYFGLGIQVADADILPIRYRAIVYLSEAIRKASRRFAILSYAADSLFVEARRAS
jgi:SAM-dependent methyltransferase/uncharacterized protein YbaR (Trm112 family)